MTGPGVDQEIMEYGDAVELPLDATTLILCRDLAHCEQAEAALGIDAKYQIWSAPTYGSRWQKIIVLSLASQSMVEAGVFKHMCQQVLPTRLRIGGRIYVL